jgi:hypothetical protein
MERPVSAARDVDTYLSPAEIRRLTGRQKAKAQCRVLDARKIRYTRDGDGWPIVARAHVEKRLTGEAKAPEPANEPDFSCFPRLVRL